MKRRSSRRFRPEEIEERERELLAVAKEMMPRLPFNEIDLLIVDEMGKNISGTGIDPNVTGRNRDILGVFPTRSTPSGSSSAI